MNPGQTPGAAQGAVIAASDFRRVLAHLPTGVTVATAYGASGPVGMAANSVTSVSLDPPLILICPAKSSTTWPEIRDSGRFCVNVLAHNHESLCRQFAGPSKDRFADVPWSEPALTARRMRRVHDKICHLPGGAFDLPHAKSTSRHCTRCRLAGASHSRRSGGRAQCGDGESARYPRAGGYRISIRS